MPLQALSYFAIICTHHLAILIYCSGGAHIRLRRRNENFSCYYPFLLTGTYYMNRFKESIEKVKKHEDIPKGPCPFAAASPAPDINPFPPTLQPPFPIVQYVL